MEASWDYLQSLAGHPLHEDSIASALLTLSQDEFTPLNVCSTASEYMQQFDLFNHYRNLLAIGMFSPDIYLLHDYSGGHIDVAGCDMQNLVLNITTSALNGDDRGTLADALESAGQPVETELEIDLNADQVSDWLVWINDSNLIWVALSSDEGYTISKTQNLPLPGDYAEYILQPLPDESGNLLAVVETKHEDDTSNFSRCPFPDGPSDLSYEPPTRIQIYKIIEDKFRYMLRSELCTEEFVLEDVFVGDEIHLWSTDEYYILRPVEYVWNAPERTYFSRSNSSAAFSTVEDTNGNEINFYAISNRIKSAYANGDYQEVADLTAELSDSMPVDLSYEFLELLVYRALALQALGRNDEALTNYVTIYETAPDSMWGEFAALHIESVADD